MPLEIQKAFDWKIVLYLFLGGMGGGLFFTGFILDRLNLIVPVAKSAELLGPVAVLIGCFFLLLHAGSGFKTKVYLLFLKPGTSWISRGTWIITIFVASALLYVWSGTVVLGWVAAIFSSLMTIYPGVLLSENKAIPFWSTPALPILFFFSGLSSGLAVLLLLVPFLSSPNDETMAVTLLVLSWYDLVLIGIQLIILWTYLGARSKVETTFSKSLRLMKRPLFIFGTLILGLLLPLFLHIFAIMGGKMPGFGVITGILLVIGSISLRFSVIRAGVFLPRHTL